MDRLISLTVKTKGFEDYANSFMDMAELGRALGSNHEYVNMSAQVLDGVEEDVPEELTHDESTMITVKRAISKALQEEYSVSTHPALGPSSPFVTRIVNELQNAGILFRERSK